MTTSWVPDRCEAALLARRSPDWIGGLRPACRYSVQNRGVAYQDNTLTFDGTVIASGSTATAAWSTGHRRAPRRRRVDAGHRDGGTAAPRDGFVWRLPVRAAIVGSPELPAERKPTRPELFTRPVRPAGLGWCSMTLA